MRVVEGWGWEREEGGTPQHGTVSVNQALLLLSLWTRGKVHYRLQRYQNSLCHHALHTPATFLCLNPLVFGHHWRRDSVCVWGEGGGGKGVWRGEVV